MKPSVLSICLMLLAVPASAQFTLTLTAYGNGSVNVSPQPDLNGGTQYTSGTQVTLIAQPAALWNFDRYESGAFTSTADTVQFTMNQDRDVQAYFKKGNLLFVRDETQNMMSLATQMRTLFESVDLVVYGAQEIVIDDTTTILAPFEALGGANITTIRNRMVTYLDSIKVVADTLKVVVQQ